MPSEQVEEFLKQYKEAHGALHRNWTKAVGTERYVKNDWRILEGALERFARAQADELGYEGPLLPHIQDASKGQDGD